MTRITLPVLCEGQTEERFVTQVLHPYLLPVLVYAKAESLTPRGHCIVSYDKLRSAIKREVGRAGPAVYVTTMLDLYRIGDYLEAAAKPSESPYDRVARIEHVMEDGLPNPRFIPYVQLHEFETLVLVDVDKIPAQFPGNEAEDAPDRLRQWIGNTPPELVDDGSDTAPSKRLISVVPRYKELKAVVGPTIAREITIERLRAACPNFNQWISRLERLAEQD